MTSAILIPWALTDWQAAGRFATRTPVNINADGEAQLDLWVPEIAANRPVAIYGLDKGPGDQTAEHLGKKLAIRVRKSPRLQEIALGLWEGLTAEDLKKRFAKSYKQWKEDPASVCPPEGEDLPQAVDRLIAEINRIARKHKGECFAVVLGPLALAAVRCRLENRSFEDLWTLTAEQPVHYELKLEANTVVAAA